MVPRLEDPLIFFSCSCYRSDHKHCTLWVARLFLLGWWKIQASVSRHIHIVYISPCSLLKMNIIFNQRIPFSKGNAAHRLFFHIDKNRLIPQLFLNNANAMIALESFQKIIIPLKHLICGERFCHLWQEWCSIRTQCLLNLIPPLKTENEF